MELCIKNITKYYGANLALDRFSYTLTSGVYGLLGPNGAGKSTLMNILAGILPQSDGSVLWNGEEIRRLGEKYRKILGFMPQQETLYPEFRAREFLYYMASLNQIPKADQRRQVERVLAAVRLTEAGDSRIRTFSGGMRRRLLLAQAILNQPELLILDEPTAGLDPQQRIFVRKLLAELSQNCIVLVATHVVPDVERVAKQILMLKQGKLVEQGSPEELVSRVHTESDNMTSSLEGVYLHYFGEEEWGN